MSAYNRKYLSFACSKERNEKEKKEGKERKKPRHQNLVFLVSMEKKIHSNAVYSFVIEHGFSRAAQCFIAFPATSYYGHVVAPLITTARIAHTHTRCTM